jgi:hypothetical protein
MSVIKNFANYWTQTFRRQELFRYSRNSLPFEEIKVHLHFQNSLPLFIIPIRIILNLFSFVYFELILFGDGTRYIETGGRT